MADKTRIGGIIQNDRISRISILGMPDEPGVAATVLGILADAGINVCFIIQFIDLEDQDHFVLCVDREDLTEALQRIDAGTRDKIARRIVHQAHAASIAIFGPDFRERPGIAAAMFRCLAGAGVNIDAISTSISTVTCLIAAARLDDALAAIRQTFDVP